MEMTSLIDGALVVLLVVLSTKTLLSRRKFNSQMMSIAGYAFAFYAIHVYASATV